MSISQYTAENFRKAMNASPIPEWYLSDVPGASMGEFSFNDAVVRNHSGTADGSEVSDFYIKKKNGSRPCIYPYPYNKNADSTGFSNAFMEMTFSWDDTSDIYDVYGGYAGYYKNWFGSSSRNTSRNFLWSGEISPLDSVTREIKGFYGNFTSGDPSPNATDRFYLFFNMTSDPYSSDEKTKKAWSASELDNPDFWDWARLATSNQKNRNWIENTYVYYEASFSRQAGNYTFSGGSFGQTMMWSWNFTYNNSSHSTWSGSNSRVGDEIHWATFRNHIEAAHYYLFLYG
jgi:hypothetical protein